jgi:hypothetical protein
MERYVIVPKQRVDMAFVPECRKNITNYAKLHTTYNLKFLGIEIEPINDRYWEYDVERILLEGSFEGSYRFLGNKSIAHHYGWLVLPERAKVFVRKNITIQELFEALQLDGDSVHWVPDFDNEYYHFPLLFEKVASKGKFKRKLAKILDSSSFAKASSTVSIQMLGRQPGQKVIFEFIVTDFADWTFIRLASIEHQGAKFQYRVKRPNRAGIYKPNSRDVELLKHSLIVFTRSDLPMAAYNLLERLLDIGNLKPRECVFVNEDLGLRLALDSDTIYFDGKILDVKFRNLQFDYTTFLDV